jgi:hypothetical protein
VRIIFGNGYKGSKYKGRKSRAIWTTSVTFSNPSSERCQKNLNLSDILYTFQNINIFLTTKPKNQIMKAHMIIMAIMMLPVFMNAQRFDPSQIRPPIDIFPMQKKYPQVPEITPTTKPLYRSRIENAQVKLATEERKLIKLARKAREQEDDLRKEQENLKNLEDTPENSNDPAYH